MQLLPTTLEEFSVFQCFRSENRMGFLNVMLTDTASLPDCISMWGKINATTYLNAGIVLVA